ncbi:biotin transporter BioY [Desulfovibrio oxyclinae]|jgi:biotin transport system substrate-specific component|uniref:biotin transporter BioY n=1 Tax=Desulfovibrio oxyclinae TaxID=63560 RepID=UPI0003818B38|nr:biotin transporter BioY [Desulfovibrio oxyclinae]
MAEGIQRLSLIVWTAIMASAIAVGAYLIVPIGPVPISMQPLFVFLAGMILGPRYGMAAVGLYILAGIAGMPVFSGGGAGIGYALGPTGGYLVGFLLSPLFTGRVRDEQGGFGWISGLFWGLCAMLVIYGIGSVWLKMSLDLTWGKTLTVGVIPFAPWDELKVVAAILISRYLQRISLLPG